VTHPIVTDELDLLRRVRTLLEEVPYVAPPREREIVAELVRIRDEVQEAKDEDKPALLQQYEHHHALLEQLRTARAATGEVDPASPYFAHLRVSEDGRTRDVLIGKATRIDRGLRIVDWRHAPVSRVFYRYREGEEYEEEMGGRTVAGEVVARRTVAIRNGALDRVDTPAASFLREDDRWQAVDRTATTLAGGQGSAARAHAPGEGAGRQLGTDPTGARTRRDKHLPDIAGLLDPEQFALITRPSAGFVVIRGAAGSGKTTVALHRIAWLAYDDRSVDSDRTLFVVFSPALREYVQHVLPALGIHGAQVRDYRSWAAFQRKRHFPRLPPHVREDTPASVVKLKLHPALLVALERQVARRPGPPTLEQAVDDWMSTITNRDAVEAILAESGSDAFTNRELDQAFRWTHERSQELLAWFDREEEGRGAALDDEDASLLLRAHQLRAGPLRGKGGGPLTFRHIAIDEVQDFSPLEVRVLLACLDRHQSITLAGDTQQHVMKDAGFTSWADFFGHLGVSGVAVDTLRIAYRSAAPIVRFGLALLGDAREDDAPPVVTRDGPPVELFRFTDAGAAVAFLADALKRLLHDEPAASVALLCPDDEIASLYAQGLLHAETPRVRRVVAHEFRFEPGIDVTGIEQAKGLEFDYVVVLEASAQRFPDSLAARRQLHVAATRAIHQLWLVTVGAPAPAVLEALGA